MGKYHEKFAGVRILIEFKYYSNAGFKKLKSSIEVFKPLDADVRQLTGYADALKQEYPEADIAMFVIYCFGNQGFRVFDIKH